MIQYSEIESRARAALADNGIIAPDHIEADKMTCCKCEGHADPTAGRFILHVDMPPTVWCCNHYVHDPEGVSVCLLHAGESDGMTDAERDQLRQEIAENKARREQETAERHAAVAKQVREDLKHMKPATDANGYLARKGVHAVVGLKEDSQGRLVIPAFDETGEVVTMQTVPTKGDKMFRKDGKSKDVYFPVHKRKDGPLCLAEGIATALSVYEATGWAVLSVYSAGNLLGVAKLARQTYPDREIVIAGDNDTTQTDKNGVVHRRPPEDNVGRIKAMAAAEAIGARCVICPEVNEASTDFNDLAQAKGLDAVKAALQTSVETSEPWGEIATFEETRLPRLDVSLFPPIMADFVKTVSESVEVPLELPASMGMATTSVACQRHIFIRVTDTYRETTNLYFCTALDPANRKSTVVSICTKVLGQWEKQQRDKLLPEIKSTESRRKTMLAAIEAQRRKAAATEDEAKRDAIQLHIEDMERKLPEIIRLPRLLADDVTPEQLAVLAFNNDETIAIISAEGGLMDTLAGRYSNMPNLDFVLKAFSADPVKVDRKHDQPIWLDAPRLTLGLSPQPVTLQERLQAKLFRKRGLDGRFLYLLPPNILGTRKLEGKRLDKAAVDRFEGRILNILDDVKTDVEIRLDADAFKVWHDFSLDVEHELADDGEFASMRDWGGKLAGKVVRIAGLLHMFEHDQPLTCPILAPTMMRACKLGAFFTEHAKAAYSLMGTDDSVENAKAVLAWIKRIGKPTFSERDALNGCKGQLNLERMDSVRSAIKELEERGYIRRMGGESKKGRGRPKSLPYEVNPAILKGGKA